MLLLNYGLHAEPCGPVLLRRPASQILHFQVRSAQFRLPL